MDRDCMVMIWYSVTLVALTSNMVMTLMQQPSTLLQH